MGRSVFKFEESMRQMVAELVAQGVPHETIGGRIGARSPKVLRKHFSVELDTAATEANRAVAKTLFAMATDGKNATATMFWLKCRARWGSAIESFEEESRLEFVRE